MIYAPHTASIDAIYSILRQNPALRRLELSIQGLQNSVIPNMDDIGLNELQYLSLEGAPQFVQLLQHLTLPALTRVNIKFDVPQTLDFSGTFKELLTRSDYPPITFLSIQQPYRTQETNLHYLKCLPDLEELSISRLPLEDVLVALDDEGSEGSFPCPNLLKLSLTNCPGRRDLDSLVPRLVRFVERRTERSIGESKRTLESLRIQNCGCIVTAPQEAWLKGRLKEFMVDEYTPFALGTAAANANFGGGWEWEVYH